MRGILLSIVCLLFATADGGFYGLQCPTALNSSILPCDIDCQINHGADDGTCGPNYNCYCTEPINSGDVTPIVQCQSSSIPILGATIQAGYQAICTADCACNHGAVGGTCNFQYQRCECGENSTNSCPYGSINAFLTVVNALEGALALLLGINPQSVELIG